MKKKSETEKIVEIKIIISFMVEDTRYPSQGYLIHPGYIVISHYLLVNLSKEARRAENANASVRKSAF